MLIFGVHSTQPAPASYTCSLAPQFYDLSIYGLQGFARYSVYYMTEFGIIEPTKSLTAELGPMGIWVNAVAPGPTDTPTFARNVKGDERKGDVKRIALGQLGRTEVANVVVNGSVWEVHSGGEELDCFGLGLVGDIGSLSLTSKVHQCVYNLLLFCKITVQQNDGKT